MTEPHKICTVTLNNETFLCNHKKDVEAMKRPATLFLEHNELTRKLPIKVDLRNSRDMPPVLHQGSLGSCTAHACCQAIRFSSDRQKDIKWMPSRLFMYYFGRLVGNFNTTMDSGCNISSIMFASKQYGICNENLWPYEMHLAHKIPSNEAQEKAIKPSSRYQYYTVPKNMLKQNLAQGYPVMFGFGVTREFIDIREDGIMKMPKGNDPDANISGGHAVLMVGYDERKKWFIVQNSWGDRWGKAGYCFMPESFIMNEDYTWDCWTVRNYL